MKSRIYAVAAVWPLLGGLVLSGCVSVFEGTSEEINVATNPSEASCTFERDGKTLGTIPKTPGSLVVRKSKYDITIKCDKPGYQQASYFNHSGTTDTIAANVVVDLLLTAGISSIVDSANGADNYYEPAVNITLTPMLAGQPGMPGASPASAPAASTAPAVVPAAATPGASTSPVVMPATATQSTGPVTQKH